MNRKYFYHIFGWVFFFAIITSINVQNYVPKVFAMNAYLLKQLAEIGIIAIIFYLNFSLVSDRFLIRKKRILFFVIGVIGILVIEAGLSAVLAYYLDQHLGMVYYTLTEPIHYLQSALLPLFILFISTGVRYGKEYLVEKKEKEAYKSDFESAKLLALKLQLSPHFLFNTLNNIYSLAETHPSKCARSILNLSELMRYVVSVEKIEEVELNKEVDFIKNLIELQKLRINDENLIKLEIEISDEKAKIAPLLLLSFTENAFKHTNFVGLKEPVSIRLTEEGGQIEYEVRNRVDRTNLLEESGIGLDNLKSRLNILYKDKYELSTSEEDDFFVAHLKLNA